MTDDVSECIDVSKFRIATIIKNSDVQKEIMQEQATVKTNATIKTQDHGQHKNENGNGIENNNDVSISNNIDIGVGGDVSGIRDDSVDALGFGISNDKKKRAESKAYMPCPRHAMEYNMTHKHRGRALIFNHEKFSSPSLSQRNGTDRDCENLTKVLNQLDFKVSSYKDFTFEEIKNIIMEVASEDHTQNDCLWITILSHGDYGSIYASDAAYKLDDISHYFTGHMCPSLAGKPKLFFIQACRGDNFDAGIVLNRTETDSESSANYKIPVHADFLFMYSTIPGTYSWRSPENGSWFIQALVAELNANSKVNDLLTLLTFVNQRVAMDFESNVPHRHIMHGQKQIPCITSMLTRILRFNDKNAQIGDN